MEVPVINRISNFDGAGVTCLQNPSFVSQILSITAREKLFHAHNFWKWGAFIIAMIASFGTIISRIKILVIRIQCHFCKDSSASQPLLDNFDDYDFTSDDEDDEVDEEDDDDDVSCSSYDSDGAPSSYSDDMDCLSADEDFHVKGSRHYAGHDQSSNLGLRRRRSFVDQFSWSDFSSGKSVVKLWDSLGLGLGLDGSPNQKIVSLYSSSSPAAILSAEGSDSGRVTFGVWDTRVGSRIPAILADWGPQLGKIVGVATNGAEKVYVGDDVTGGLTIGDLRKVSSPLKKFSKADVDETWWDADSGLVSDESAAVSRLDSAATRCCDAVRSYLL
ncbi:uncharacterized protein LOC133821942 [Humulus lupulus]|uniref:uncharacterized protein LOC133821942 n=1 Tax=Humulus lupulus TaxID=3486 RepID=UPI002B4131F2|nr:uncharacterized protein LOC133821942 [Humulus lupulus]